MMRWQVLLTGKKQSKVIEMGDRDKVKEYIEEMVQFYDSMNSDLTGNEPG